jgi:thymidylate synthase (FAD)
MTKQEYVNCVYCQNSEHRDRSLEDYDGDWVCNFCARDLKGFDPEDFSLVEPKVILIAKTQLIREGVKELLSDMGAPNFPVDPDHADGENLVMVAGKRCYKSFHADLNPNLTRVREDMAAFVKNILKTGHGSVLEHVNFTFSIENVSRVLTAELNRHRAGAAISEASGRYIRFGDEIPFWMPGIFKEDKKDSIELRDKKAMSRYIFHEMFDYAKDRYQKLVRVWDKELNSKSFTKKKKITSAARRIIPIGHATGGVWTYNIRSLRHIFAMRCASAAEEEIIMVACMMLKIMQEQCPNAFGDFYFDEKKSQWTPKHWKV